MHDQIENGMETVHLPGDYSVEGEHPRRIEITELSSSRCLMVPRDKPLKLGMAISLWIGAIGPIPGAVMTQRSNSYEVKFTEPLPEAVVDHFHAISQ